MGKSNFENCDGEKAAQQCLDVLRAETRRGVRVTDELVDGCKGVDNGLFRRWSRSPSSTPQEQDIQRQKAPASNRQREREKKTTATGTGLGSRGAGFAPLRNRLQKVGEAAFR